MSPSPQRNGEFPECSTVSLGAGEPRETTFNGRRELEFRLEMVRLTRKTIMTLITNTSHATGLSLSYKVNTGETQTTGLLTGKGSFQSLLPDKSTSQR